MGIFLGDHKISSGGGGLPDIPLFFLRGGGGGGGGGSTEDAGSKPWHEEKLRVAPMNDTYSLFSF